MLPFLFKSIVTNVLFHLYLRETLTFALFSRHKCYDLRIVKYYIEANSILKCISFEKGNTFMVYIRRITKNLFRVVFKLLVFRPIGSAISVVKGPLETLTFARALGKGKLAPNNRQHISL